MYEAVRDEWLAKKIRDWLLAVLRFALTLEESDKQSILAMAEDMDRLGAWPGRAPFGFFLRTSADLCRAVAYKDDPNRITVIRRWLMTIDDRRLRQATAVAVDLEEACRAQFTSARLK